MMNRRHLARVCLWGAAIGTAAIISGCGGGSSSTASSTATGSTATATAGTMVITSSNAQQVASTVFSGSSLAQISTQNLALKAITGSGQPVNVMGVVAQTVAQDVRQFVRLPSGAVAPIALTQASSTTTCSGGGQLVVTANEADPNVGLQAGDSVTIQATGCVQSSNGYTVTLDGTLSEAIASLNTSSSAVQASVTLQAINFTVTDSSGNSESLNGNLTASVAVATSPDQTVNVGLSSTGLSLTETIGGVQSAIDLVDLNYSVYADATTGSWQFSEDATVSLGGETVGVQTTTPFSGSGCGYPTAGSATLVGNGSSLVVTAGSNGQTALQVTNNGATSSQAVASSAVFGLFCY